MNPLTSPRVEGAMRRSPMAPRLSQAFGREFGVAELRGMPHAMMRSLLLVGALGGCMASNFAEQKRISLGLSEPQMALRGMEDRFIYRLEMPGRLNLPLRARAPFPQGLMFWAVGDTGSGSKLDDFALEQWRTIGFDERGRSRSR